MSLRAGTALLLVVALAGGGACTTLLGVADVPSVAGDAGHDDTASDAKSSDSGARCVIGGTLYASDAANPTNGCQGCEWSVSTSAWSDRIDGTRCGTGGLCRGGTCVSGCEIGGVYYMTDTPNPNDPCQTCQPGVSTSAWSSSADGTACGNGQVCGNGQCGTQCDIAHTLVASGAVNPANACQVCEPGTSTAAWTGASGGTSCGSGEVCSGASCMSGCYVGGQVYSSGEADPSNPCQTCEPKTSATAWTNLNGVSCQGSGTCASGSCFLPRSCSPGGAGLTNCGATDESCCTSPEVMGGTYYRTYDPAIDGGVMVATDGGPTGEADPATVSGFRLDKYLVTVGRFRQFVSAWKGGTGYAPPAGSGKHTHLNAGKGLVAAGGDAGLEYETGWVASDDNNIAPTNTNLSCSPDPVWTDVAGSQENLPIQCVNWYEAYAFCVWDGGFLPSEAEWEYAAAGGAQQRAYPWGSAAPGTQDQYAIYGCYYPGGSGSGSGSTSCANVTPAMSAAPVGTATLGSGLWGQLDLAGNLVEWALDSYVPSYVDPCIDCAFLESTSLKVGRGGMYASMITALVPSWRVNHPPTFRGGPGIRCARSP